MQLLLCFLYSEIYIKRRTKKSKRKNYKEYQGATIGRFSISLEDLRVLVGYPESYRATDVRRYILDAAVKENHLDAINEYKRNLEYVRAVDMKLEELSAEEQKQFKEEETAAETEENN